MSETEAERLLDAIWSVRRGVRRTVGAPLGDGALTGAHLELLRLLRRRPGIGVGDAAGALGVAPNTVSTLVRRLVDLDYVRRETDPADGRAARLLLTEEAGRRLQERRDRRVGAMVEALDNLPSDQRVHVQPTIELL